MTDKIEELSSFPPNSNPYHHDLWNMGQDFSKEWHMMFSNHTTESAEWVIFIHTPTGRRFRINLNNLLKEKWVCSRYSSSFSSSSSSLPS